MNRREIEKKVFDLIIIGSPRVKFHPVIVSTRHTISPGLCNHIEFISFDEKLYRSLVVCKHCHLLFNNQRWNRNVISRHLDKFHGIDLNAVDDEGDKTEVKPRSQVAHRGGSIKNRKRAHKDTEKVPQPETVHHQSEVPSDKIGHTRCGRKQANEDGGQEVKIENVMSESIPARETSLQVAIAQEPEAALIECTISDTQVPITGSYTNPKVGDQVDFCSTLAQSQTKTKSTRQRTAKKGVGGPGGKAIRGARGDVKGTGGDASESDSKAST